MKPGLWLSCIAAGTVIEQTFIIADTDGLKRVLHSPEGEENAGDYLFARPCTQTPFGVPLITRSLDLRHNATRSSLNEAATAKPTVCVDVISNDSAGLTVIYGNSQHDPRLSRSWRDLTHNNYTTLLCPAIGIVGAKSDQTAAPATTTIVANDYRFSFNALSDELSGETVKIEERAETERDGFTYKATLTAPTPVIYGATAEIVARQLAEAPCYLLTFESSSFTPQRIESLKTEYYLPMWGNHARVNEEYSVINEAAAITGHYNANAIKHLYGRTLGTFRAGPPALARNGVVMGFLAEFPPETATHEFYDRIGNITTSEVISLEADGQLMVFYPRHPLLGQWRASWTLRYSPPQQNLVIQAGTTGTVVVPGRTAVAGFWCDKRRVRVILPPFSRILSFDSWLPPAQPAQIHKERQWLDIWPSRTILEVEFGPYPNYRQMTQGLLIIRYEYNRTAALLSHLAWFFVPVLVIWSSARLFDLKKF